MAVSTIVMVDGPFDPNGQGLVVSNTVSDAAEVMPSTLLLPAPHIPDETAVVAEEMTYVPDEMDDVVGLDDIVVDNQMDDGFLGSDTRNDGDNEMDPTDNDDEQFQNSSKDDDSNDLGWKLDLYESSESSEDDVSVVNSFDGSGVTAELQYHSSEEDCLKQGRRTNDRGNEHDVDPSKNIPRGPPLYDSIGRLVLSIN